MKAEGDMLLQQLRRFDMNNNFKKIWVQAGTDQWQDQEKLFNRANQSLIECFLQSGQYKRMYDWPLIHIKTTTNTICPYLTPILPGEVPA